MESKIGWVQGRSRGSLEGNGEAYLDDCEVLASRGCEVIFLPELVFWDYFPIREDPSLCDEAIALDAPLLRRYSAWAAKAGVVLTVPIFERRASGLYHNTVVVYGPDGECIDLYRKMHIPDDPCFYEKYYFAPGDLGWKVVETPKLKIGLLICWDQWFPEAARLTAMEGAQLLYYPTAIGWDVEEPAELHPRQLESWMTIVRSHSVANGVFTLAVNRVGQEENLKFWGHSLLADPSGGLMNQPYEKEGCEVALLNTEAIEEQRKMWPFFRDRRIDAYKGLTKRWGD